MSSLKLPQDDFIQAVRESCFNCQLRNADEYKVDKDALNKFSEQITLDEIKQAVDKTITGLPLKFDDLEQELNVTVLIDLLNFGSGYRNELKHSFGRGAAETILYGVMSMHLAGISMSPESLSTASPQLVSDWFSLPLKQEEPHPEITGLYVFNPTPFSSLVDKLTKVLNETGTVLKSLGYRGLGHCILELSKPNANIDASNDQGSNLSTTEFVSKLVNTFPSLQDLGSDNGTPVYIFKRAQLITANLYIRYRETKPNHFNFTGIDKLTILADNVIPTILIHNGIIVPPKEILDSLEAGKKISDHSMLVLRALSVNIVDELATILNTKGWNTLINSVDLDRYIWQTAKIPELRKLNRLLNTSTVYF